MDELFLLVHSSLEVEFLISGHSCLISSRVSSSCLLAGLFNFLHLRLQVFQLAALFSNSSLVLCCNMLLLHGQFLFVYHKSSNLLLVLLHTTGSGIDLENSINSPRLSATSVVTPALLIILGSSVNLASSEQDFDFSTYETQKRRQYREY